MCLNTYVCIYVCILILNMCTCLYNYKYVKMASYQSLCNGNELLNACRKGSWTLSEAFLYKICLRSTTLSAMVATCCGQLIGCHSCTDTWYTTNADIMKQTCPACRAIRGAARLCQLRGKESLIKTGKEVLQDAEPTPDDRQIFHALLLQPSLPTTVGTYVRTYVCMQTHLHCCWVPQQSAIQFDRL